MTWFRWSGCRVRLVVGGILLPAVLLAIAPATAGPRTSGWSLEAVPHHGMYTARVTRAPLLTGASRSAAAAVMARETDGADLERHHVEQRGTDRSRQAPSIPCCPRCHVCRRRSASRWVRTRRARGPPVPSSRWPRSGAGPAGLSWRPSTRATCRTSSRASPARPWTSASQSAWSMLEWTLAEEWDGTSWSLMTTLDPGPDTFWRGVL